MTLTDQDIDRLMTVLATKEKQEEIAADIAELKSQFNGLITAVDGLTKVIEDLRLEYAAVKTQLDRHERWIQEIAKKAGVSLEY